MSLVGFDSAQSPLTFGRWFDAPVSAWSRPIVTFSGAPLSTCNRPDACQLLAHTFLGPEVKVGVFTTSVVLITCRRSPAHAPQSACGSPGCEYSGSRNCCGS